MPKSNKSLTPGEIAQSTLKTYYPVVPNPSKTKNQEKALETKEVIEFFNETNDNGKNDDSTTTSIPNNTKTEKVSTKEINTATTNMI